MLVTVSEQCDQKIMALRDQEKQGIMTYLTFVKFTKHSSTLSHVLIIAIHATDSVDLKNENKRLYKRIDELRQDQLSLQSQVRHQISVSHATLPVILGKQDLPSNASVVNLLQISVIFAHSCGHACVRTGGANAGGAGGRVPALS